MSAGRSLFGSHGMRGTEAELWRRVRIGLAAMCGVLLAGTGAYRWLGLGWVDAFYQTLITVTTVGFTEVGPVVGSTYRLVSSALILGGVGVTAYTVGVAFEALMEGGLTDRFRRRRMTRAIDELTGHVIVCGYGRVGRAITEALRSQGVSVVVVDCSPDVLDTHEGLEVIGDATDDEVLRGAGVESARGLVAALDTDADNLYVTLSGRALNPGLYIVSRLSRTGSAPKLLQAGADRVVNPHQIGGARMAAFLVHPNVADFLGESMSAERLEVRLVEAAVEGGDPFAGRTLGESGLVAATGLTVLAVRRSGGGFVHHPGPDALLAVGDVVIALGTPLEEEALGEWLGGVRAGAGDGVRTRRTR